MSSINHQPVIEPLTERELQILRRLSRGMSNRGIAEDLVVTPGTVKWYNKQIYRKLGVHTRTEAVARARQAGLFDDEPEPQLVSLPSPGHNLPARMTSFVGREWETQEIKRLLGTSRLLTLTGAGGSGKTRLALEVVRGLLPVYRDGIWFVDLSSISQVSSVPNAIAGALNVDLHAGPSAIVILTRSLSRKQLLLVMDNFEHLLEASSLVGELLEAAPKLTVLATSRERLNIYGEQEFPVLPLALPGRDHRQSAGQLHANDAVQLFLDRARAAQAGFELTADTLPQVARICVLLDGLPLAIELCAPQVKMFSPAEIVQRLEESSHSLPAGPRNLPARQRTMRAALEWSTKLLGDGEDKLFTRMAVFSGGGTLQAVEKICGFGLSGNLVNRLFSLVDRNLVQPREARAGEMRFFMLEIIRELNIEHLRLVGDDHQVNHRYAGYYKDLVETAAAQFSSTRHTYWFALLQDESDNIRSALSWSLLEGELELSMRIVAGLRDYWNNFGLASEGLHYAGMVLKDAEKASSVLRAGVLMTTGNFCLYLNDFISAQDYLLQALDLFKNLGDEPNTAWCKVFLSAAYLESTAGIQHGIDLGNQGLDYFRKSGDLAGMARAYNALGELARLEGDYAGAERCYHSCLELCKQTGEKLRESFQYVNLGLIAYHNKEYLRSEQFHMLALKILFEMDTVFGMASHLASLAGPTAALGHPQRAARMLGAADVQLESMGVTQQAPDQPEIELYVESVKKALGEAAYQQAWQEGSIMTIREAVRSALEGEDSTAADVAE